MHVAHPRFNVAARLEEEKAVLAEQQVGGGWSRLGLEVQLGRLQSSLEGLG